MRKPRVIIAGSERGTIDTLSGFFQARGYETLLFRDHGVCPVSRKGERCPVSPVCADIAVFRQELPSLRAVDLLAAQRLHGCGLAAENKAVISPTLDAADRAEVTAAGSAFFASPVDLRSLEPWVAQCETRMNLERPVAIKRKEQRTQAGAERLVLLLRGAEVEPIALVNRSECGACLRTVRHLEPNQMLQVRSSATGTIEDAMVRWIRRADDDSYIVGLSYCA